MKQYFMQQLVKMMQNKCRSCYGELFETPLVVYENMPSIAQFLPEKNNLDKDIGIDIEVCQCSKCGLIQILSEPVHYYKEVVRSSGFSPEMVKFRNEQFKEFISKYELKNKSIVEIGCGKGEYLSIMSQYCIDALGIEYSKESIKECKKNNLKVQEQFLDEQTPIVSDKKYDAFYMMNFLEHIPCPSTILQLIYKNLSVDAVGLIEVPNFDLTLENNIFTDFSTEHLSYFTIDTFKRILENNGFEVINIEIVWYKNIISAEVRKRKKLNIDRFKSYRDKFSQNVYQYLNLFDKKEVVIWGAGHQSLATLALLDIKDKINYIVDSAIFKQGKFTPATHIPIKSPLEMEKDNISTVLVNATSYSDEVASVVIDDYKFIQNVAILRDSGIEVIKGKGK